MKALFKLKILLISKTEIKVLLILKTEIKDITNIENWN